LQLGRERWIGPAQRLDRLRDVARQFRQRG